MRYVGWRWTFWALLGCALARIATGWDVPGRRYSLPFFELTLALMVVCVPLARWAILRDERRAQEERHTRLGRDGKSGKRRRGAKR